MEKISKGGEGYITYYLIAASALLPALKRLKMIGRQ
jgi:Mg2+/citrate symporter